MKTIITTRAIYEVYSYPSNVEIYKNHERIANIECTGDSPVTVSKTVCKSGDELASNLNEWNIKKLINKI